MDTFDSGAISDQKPGKDLATPALPPISWDRPADQPGQHAQNPEMGNLILVREEDMNILEHTGWRQE